VTSQMTKRVARRSLVEFIGGRNPNAADDVLDENVVMHPPGSSTPLYGRRAFKEAISNVRAAFPDLQVDEHDTIVEGEIVASRWTASGTHTGLAFAEQPATGRHFEIAGMSFYRLANGKIVEGWVVEDILGLLRQLGISVPEATTTADE
jgi:steroid delta-isomerase-like uncharacterized protein